VVSPESSEWEPINFPEHALPIVEERLREQKAEGREDAQGDAARSTGATSDRRPTRRVRSQLVIAATSCRAATRGTVWRADARGNGPPADPSLPARRGS
jgi:hypothetical protein